MEIRLNFSAYGKVDRRFLFEGEVSVRINKQESFDICQNYFVWPFPGRSSAIEPLYERGLQKARGIIYKERALKRNEYELKIEIADNQSDLFTDAFIKEFFKWVLKDAHNNGFNIYNDHGLKRFCGDAIRVFSEYYSGNLALDAEKIQERIMRQ